MARQWLTLLQDLVGLAQFTDLKLQVLEVFLDLASEGLNPDGAITDAEGGFWSAQWGAGRVARNDSDGRFDWEIALPAPQISCPALGGPDLRTWFATSARDGLDAPAPQDGCTFAVPSPIPGHPEPRVIIA